VSWWEAYRLVDSYGGREADIPAKERRKVLADATDPKAVWSSAINKFENEQRRRRAIHSRRARIAAIEAEGPLI